MVVIAIDGPSGSGKSSVSKAVARRLGLAYLDTGAMYRAATLWALRQCGSLGDAEAVAAAVRNMPLEVGLSPDDPHFVLAGDDVSEAIRDSSVSTQVSQVATNLAVRDELRRRQREIIDAAQRGGAGIVAEGRDITTVVAPDAPVRILLTASPEARLRRRSLDVHGTADASAVAATRDEVLRRDADDSTVMEFQTAADGVTTVDSSDLNLDQTVDAVLDVASKAQVGKAHPDGAEAGSAQAGSDGHGGLGPNAGVGDSLAAMPLRGPWTPPNEGGLPTGIDIPREGDGIRSGRGGTSTDPASGLGAGVIAGDGTALEESAAWETATEVADRAPAKEVKIDTDHGRAYVAGISDGEAQRMADAFDER